MKTVILLGIVVELVLLFVAGTGHFDFMIESKKEALAEIQRRKLGRVEKLLAVGAEREVESERLQAKVATLEAELVSLKKQVEEDTAEQEEKLGKAHELQAEENRLAETATESNKPTHDLDFSEAEYAAAQITLQAKQKRSVILENRVRRLMYDYEKITQDSDFIETAESVGKSIGYHRLKLQPTLSEQRETSRTSATKAAEARVIMEPASGNLATMEKMKSAVKEEILARRRELATLDGGISIKKRQNEEGRGLNDSDTDEHR